MTFVLLVLLLPAPQQDAHKAMHDRGATVMGFDQEKTAHQFRLHDDGGTIEVRVKEPRDAKDLAAIRSHLPHIATMFQDGRFDAPTHVHGRTDVPGTAVLAARKHTLQYTYVETPSGGRVDIVTSDPVTRAALHEFLKYQIAEHKTGDPLTVSKRQ